MLFHEFAGLVFASAGAQGFEHVAHEPLGRVALEHRRGQEHQSRFVPSRGQVDRREGAVAAYEPLKYLEHTRVSLCPRIEGFEERMALVLVVHNRAG